MTNLEKLLSEVDVKYNHVVDKEVVDKLLEIIRAQSKALGFYADKENWIWLIDFGRRHIHKSDCDFQTLQTDHVLKSATGGKRAREAQALVEKIAGGD